MELLAFAQSFLDSKENGRSFLERPKKTASDWNDPLIGWFLAEKELPVDPFELKQAVSVVAPQKFYLSLLEDISDGPKGPRAIFGALQDDLKCLKKECERVKKHKKQPSRIERVS